MFQSISASQSQPVNLSQSVSAQPDPISQQPAQLQFALLPPCVHTHKQPPQSVRLAVNLSQSPSAQPVIFNQLINPSLPAASFTYSQCQQLSVSQPPCSQLPIQSAIFSQSSPDTASLSRSTLDVNARSLMHFTLYARTSAPPPLAAAPAARSPRSPLATLRSRLYGARLGRRADSARESGPTGPLRRAGAVSET